MISEAESAVMKVLWAESGLGAETVLERLANDWQLPTVKTLLNRLLSKGAIRAEKDARRFLYFPLVSKGSYVATETQSFLARVFDGELSPLLAHFSQHKSLKRNEREALKRLLEEFNDE